MQYAPTFIAVFFSWILYQVASRYHLRRQQQEKAKRLNCQPPPQLVNHRFLGIDRIAQIFEADREKRLMNLFEFHFKDLGPTMKQKLLGQETIGTIDPINIKAVLQDGDSWHVGRDRAHMIEPLFGKGGIFTEDGASWKASRKLLQPQFNHSQYEDLKRLDKVIQTFFTVLAPHNTVNLQPYFFKLTLDITTDFLFGQSVNSLTSPDESKNAQFAIAFDRAQDYVARRARLPSSFSWLVNSKASREACKIVHAFADEIIDQHFVKNQETSQDRYVFLHMLAQTCQDRILLRSQIINMLIAGRDTTACLLTWTFFLLVRHPLVLEKLKDEIHQALQVDESITRHTLKNMSYLQDILKEVLRLYPPVPINMRVAAKDTTLPVGGDDKGQSPIFIKEGTLLGFSLYSMHRREDFYGKDALQFRPERWADPSMPLNKNVFNKQWGWLPFNGGPRTCLGQEFALTEAAFVIVRLLEQYPYLFLPQNEKVVPTGQERKDTTLVLSSAEGCFVNLGNPKVRVPSF